MYKKKKGTDSPDRLLHEATPNTSETTPGNLDSAGKGSDFAEDKQEDGGKRSVITNPKIGRGGDYRELLRERDEQERSTLSEYEKLQEKQSPYVSGLEQKVEMGLDRVRKLFGISADGSEDHRFKEKYSQADAKTKKVCDKVNQDYASLQQARREQREIEEGIATCRGWLEKPEDIATPAATEQPKPKKRNKWISEEDAAEYGSLMDDLRRALGGGDIVNEEGVGYGNKKSQSNQRQDLTTSSSDPKGSAKLQKISENLSRLKNIFKGKTDKTGVLTDLLEALDAKASNDGPSRYAAVELPNGKTAEIRISNHNANAGTFAEHGHTEGNISIVIKSSRSRNTFKGHPEVELTEYVYTTEAISHDGNLLSGIAE